MRRSSPDQICALCDEFTVKLAAPEYAALGMGRCLVRDERGGPAVHVAWDSRTCISFRLDQPTLASRRQYIAQQQRAAATTEGSKP